jgi:LPS sulfotransferase NodH
MQQVENIFDRLSEARLLKTLIFKQGKLFFVGDEETIRYLKNFFQKNNPTNNYGYYCWHQKLNKLDYEIDELSAYQAIIIASIDNEHLIFERLKKELKNVNLATPIVKLFSDVFVNLMSGRQLLQTSDCDLVPPKISYAIATTPRSGSTALSNALAATGIAGFPKEHLRFPSQVLAQNCQFDYVRYLQILMTHRTTENGVFGTKFISHFFKSHSQSSYDFKEILDRFHFVYLIRRDKLAQATSVLVAQKTKTWHISSNKKYQDYQAKLTELDIQDSELEKLHILHQNILTQERFWESFFEQHQISPLVIEYEQFLESPEEQVNKILKYLKIIDIDRIKILNKYQYKMYQIAKYLKIFSDDDLIGIRLKNKKIQSNLSSLLMKKYQEKYCVG